MARVTIEDCLKKEENRFKLVQAAVKRVLQLKEKAPMLIQNPNKNSDAVVALREIAAGEVKITEAEQETFANSVFYEKSHNKIMKDVQNQKDDRRVDIDKVGIKDLLYPIKVLEKKGNYQNTTAKINMYVNLPHTDKGTHMSRFIERLNVFCDGLSFNSFKVILNDIKKDLNAVSSYIEITFPYFIKKQAPVSKLAGFMDYECSVIGKLNDENNLDLILRVKVPINSVCPCSKEISDNNSAHNQRAKADVSIRFNKFMWIEDIVKIIEKSASCELYPILKRVDEKYVTEKAFQNPKFVEDISREIAVSFKQNSNIKWFEINVESYESIHNHNAYAQIVSKKS